MELSHGQLANFRFKFDFEKFCNTNIEGFENLYGITTLDNISDFTEKVKVVFNLVSNLVPDRNLYRAFMNKKGKAVNSICY